jgi:glycosyltransferase involved in cell wall biosynthesis
MDKNEKVSIVVAIYKSAVFLDKLITSLINQTYNNIQIILVDDGSPDDSGKICDSYAEKDARIKVIHQKNSGACEARNNGIKFATGEWLVIVDGDDWLEIDYVEYMLRLVHKTNSEMGMSTEIFTTRDRVQTKEDKIETWTSEYAAAQIILPYIAIGPWNKIYKTKFIKKYNLAFSRPWSGEGLCFSSFAAQYANQVGVGHRKVYNYRLNNANSGLTHYNLTMGTNAAQNIRYIKDNLVIKTPLLINSCNWHIWKNYNFTLFLIIATDSKKENFTIYKNCLRNNRKLFISANLKADLKFKTKIKNLINGFFPVWYAKRLLKNQREAFKKDLME